MNIGKILLAGLILTLVTAAPAWAAVKVSKRDVTVKTRSYEISVEYPVTGVKAVDATLGAFIRERIAEYKSDSDDEHDGDRAYSFDLNYTVTRNDADVLVVMFWESTDTGGAHPNSFIYAFNFLMPDGAQVFLPEVVDGRRGLARISAYAIEDLTKQFDEAGGGRDDAWVRRGAGPLASNLGIFELQRKALVIHFPSYQVTAYAGGPQVVRVPLSYLAGYMRKDWRAPQASFSCVKAATPIEQAICADAKLARLDRQVSEQYEMNLANSYEKTAADKWRQSQRDWIVGRNRTCTGAMPAVCLKPFYLARMKVLKAPAP